MNSIEMWIIAFVAVPISVVTSTSCLQDLEDNVSAMKKDIERLNKAAFPGQADECIGEFLVNGEHYTVLDSGLTASTEYRSNSQYLAATNARLGGSTSWAPKVIDRNQWIQADLGDVMKVYGVVTQGRANADQWVKAYTIAYNIHDERPFTNVLKKGGHKVFNGNKDRHTPVLNMFQSVQARYIRISPKTGMAMLPYDLMSSDVTREKLWNCKTHTMMLIENTFE